MWTTWCIICNLTMPGLTLVTAWGRLVGWGYLVMAVYPLTMAGKIPLPKQFPHVNQSIYVFGRGYLVMAIHPLTMAGLVPVPKQFSHMNQSTYIFFLFTWGITPGVVTASRPHKKNYYPFKALHLRWHPTIHVPVLYLCILRIFQPVTRYSIWIEKELAGRARKRYPSN